MIDAQNPVYSYRLSDSNMTNNEFPELDIANGSMYPLSVSIGIDWSFDPS